MATQKTDNTEALRRLRLFNEKAQELRSYSFIAKALHEDAGFTVEFDFEKNILKSNRVGADKEARAAMCLVLRFFLQPRDNIELHQIADLYQSLPVKYEDKHWVCENLKVVDEFLDRETELALNTKPITHREVLETFLYGDQAHANADKRATLEKWKEFGPGFLFLENCFECAVFQLVRFIVWLAQMNVDAITALEQTIPASQGGLNYSS